MPPTGANLRQGRLETVPARSHKPKTPVRFWPLQPFYGSIAPMVERWCEVPRVVSSNLT